MIGIGFSIGDLNIASLEILKKCDYVYLENYTSIYNDTKKLENLIGKKVVFANRQIVESESEEIIDKAKNKNVAFLVIGDVFAATTHVDFYLRALEKTGVKVLHNISILNAVSDTGLSLYKFGRTASIPFENANIESPYDVLKQNGNMHTLFLLDLKDGKTMKFSDAVKYLLDVAGKRKDKAFNANSYCVGCCALGTENAKIAYGKASELAEVNLDIYPQCLIVVGEMHFMEEEMLKRFILHQQL